MSGFSNAAAVQSIFYICAWLLLALTKCRFAAVACHDASGLCPLCTEIGLLDTQCIRTQVQVLRHSSHASLQMLSECLLICMRVQATSDKEAEEGGSQDRCTDAAACKDPAVC